MPKDFVVRTRLPWNHLTTSFVPKHDAASKAEEMLLAMNRLHLQGIPNVKPDAFTYTAVIDVSFTFGTIQLIRSTESFRISQLVVSSPSHFYSYKSRHGQKGQHVWVTNEIAILVLFPEFVLMLSFVANLTVDIAEQLQGQTSFLIQWRQNIWQVIRG